MSEYVDNHPLSRDLPEYKQDIHDLKADNRHFSLLLERYETQWPDRATDNDMVRAEQGVEHVPDLELDGMKMQRVKLKDELVDMLRARQGERS